MVEPNVFYAAIERARASQEAREKWEAEHPEEIAAYAADQRREAEHEARLATSKRKLALSDAGVRLPDATIDALIRDSLKPTRALTEARRWLTEGTAPWLVLAGPTGCGKTVAAAALIATRAPMAAAVKAADVVRAFAGFFGDAADRQDKWKSTPMLAIDDIGTEPDADRMLNATLELMDARQSKRTTPTIVTTNLSKSEFAERYKNARLMSRMVSMVEWIALEGADLRRTQ